MSRPENHIRCQIKYDKGVENYRNTVLDVLRPVKDLPRVEKFYFLWQDYSDQYERHIQLDLILEGSADDESAKTKVNEILEKLEKDYYWEEENFLSTWWGLNSDEEDLLLEARCRNAELALKTLEKHCQDKLEHRPEEIVNRNYHLTANMHGMTYWDELKFCVRRPLEIFCVKVLPSSLYNKIFLRKELENV